MFVIEAVFISEQITEHRLGALLEISDMESFITILHDFEKHSVLVVLLGKTIACITKVYFFKGEG